MTCFAVDFERQNNHELYFEEDDYDNILAEIEGRGDIDYVHRSKEYPWGQRVMRFYDPDGHIIELAESMPSVFRKFSAQGMSAEQVAERTEHPLEFVYSVLG